MEDGQYVDGSYWFYAPNKPAPIVFGCFFLLSGLYHLWQCRQYRTWRITGLLPWSALLFVVGFVLRTIGAYHYDNLNIYISSTVFLYAAPPIYELANYVILARLLHYVPYLSPLHPSRVIVTFAGISAIVETLTGNGAAKSANSKSTPTDIDVGKGLLKAALILQIFVLTLFVGMAARFHHSCRKSGVLPKGSETRSKVTSAIVTLYISSALIGTRTIYRTVEYFAAAAIHSPQAGEAFDPESISPLIRYEWFFWVFEVSLMFSNTIMLNLRHPGKYLPRLSTTYLGADGVEREGRDFKDDRKWYIKALDPFDIIGLAKGKDKKNKWWENGNNTAEADAKTEGVTQTEASNK